MARKLEAFPETPFRSNARYPWDEWLDGSVWELIQGEDYTTKSKSMRTTAQAVARQKGGRLRVAELDGGKRMVIQFQGPQSPVAGQSAPAHTREAPARPRLPSDRDRARVIRNWAKAHGWPELADHGRLPFEVVAAFDQFQVDQQQTGGVVRPIR